MAQFQKNVINPLHDIDPTLKLPDMPLHPAHNPRFSKQFHVNVSPKVIFKHTSIHMSSELSTLDPSESNFSTPNKALRLKRPDAKHRVVQSVDLGKHIPLKPIPEPADDIETYKRRLNTPFKLEKVQSEDEQPCGILGRENINRFYDHYKKLDKIKDINHFNAVHDSVYTCFLTKSESLNLLPAKVGVLKEDGEPNKLKINHFRLGDRYAEVVSEGLKSVQSFKKFELANNRLTPKGADVLLPRLNYNAETLDLSGNAIGKIGCEHLSTILSYKLNKLVELNLEGNKLGDYALIPVFEALENNSVLRKLNVGKNFISDLGAEKIGRMLDYNNTLQELYVRWNQIKGPGGVHILNGLKHCQSMKVLDMSWNSMGLHNSGFSKAFAEYIRTNDNLIHLDLSNNYIGKEDSKIIAEALTQNHTLYGFHFQGNTGYVDSKGFLIVNDEVETSVSGQHLLCPISSVHMNHDSVKRYIGNFYEFKDCCWICEGWKPHTFGWSESETAKEEPIYVHLSYEGYKGRYLPKSNGFKGTRMVPPSPFTYFFTIENFQVVDQDQPNDEPRDPTIHYQIEGRNETTKMEHVNTCRGIEAAIVIDPKTYKPLVELQPRALEESYLPPEVMNERPTWILPMSIFRDYKGDNDDLLQKCFAFDFENNRIAKLTKNPEELEDIKKMLRAIYKPLKECYRYYSAIGAISDVWSIPLNAYTEFCTRSGIIDSKLLSTSDFDRIFIATYTKSDKTKNPRNPDRALVRHQFMEGLFRMAEQKYLGNGIVTTQKDALKMLLDENVVPFISTFDNQKWRNERLWNEQVDTVLKSYLPIFKGVYKKFSGLKTLPGQRPFMCLEEFQKLVGEAQMYNDKCGERDAILSFNFAMMTQVDELNSDRMFQMSFIEFLEAISRIVDLYSPLSYGETDTSINYETRKAQPLYIKLEGAIPNLYYCCGNDVKDVWVLPETSIFNMEEVIGKQRSTTKKRKIVRLNPTHPSSHTAYDN